MSATGEGHFNWVWLEVVAKEFVRVLNALKEIGIYSLELKSVALVAIQEAYKEEALERLKANDPNQHPNSLRRQQNLIRDDLLDVEAQCIQTIRVLSELRAIEGRVEKYNAKLAQLNALDHHLEKWGIRAFPDEETISFRLANRVEVLRLSRNLQG